ncbi:MAG: alpha-amylase [Flavobacteriia bacterium]|nr:alpha-amylase [Flavobacteriia bacterium]
MKYFKVLIFAFGAFLSPMAQTPQTPIHASVIYEVNVRQFSKEGTFAEVQKALPRLKAMGVDILWLMPIHPIGVKNRKGTLGSYYAVRDYKGINPEFGNLTDFKNLVDEAHLQGMRLIIDWVANHSSPDNVWLDQGHKDWYTLDSTGNVQPTLGTDWWDVADLNYENQEMRKEMIASMKYWVQECNIDGFRCDVAGWVPMDFWVQARKELETVKPLFMLAESEGADQHQAFDMTYGWEFHHIMNKIAQGKAEPSEILAYNEKDKEYPKKAIRMYFTSNHDENSWNGTEMERMGDARFVMAVLSYAMNGMPLIYNGQETSLNRRLLFFEKDQITWDKMDMVSFYSTLNALKHRNYLLSADRYEAYEKIELLNGGKVIAISRLSNSFPGAELVFYLNLSSEKQTVTGPSDSQAQWTNVFTGKRIKQANEPFKLAPWGYMVIEK